MELWSFHWDFILLVFQISPQKKWSCQLGWYNPSISLTQGCYRLSLLWSCCFFLCFLFLFLEEDLAVPPWHPSCYYNTAMFFACYCALRSDMQVRDFQECVCMCIWRAMWCEEDVHVIPWKPSERVKANLWVCSTGVQMVFYLFICSVLNFFFCMFTSSLVIPSEPASASLAECAWHTRNLTLLPSSF